MVGRPLYIRRRFYRPWAPAFYPRWFLWRRRLFGFGCGMLALLTLLFTCALFALLVLARHM
jgi:hypothetical protein